MNIRCVFAIDWNSCISAANCEPVVLESWGVYCKFGNALSKVLHSYGIIQAIWNLEYFMIFHESMWIISTGWWFGCHFWHFPRNIGFLSSSQLTKSIIFQRGGEKPPTRVDYQVFATQGNCSTPLRPEIMLKKILGLPKVPRWEGRIACTSHSPWGIRMPWKTYKNIYWWFDHG